MGPPKTFLDLPTELKFMIYDELHPCIELHFPLCREENEPVLLSVSREARASYQAYLERSTATEFTVHLYHQHTIDDFLTRMPGTVAIQRDRLQFLDIIFWKPTLIGPFTSFQKKHRLEDREDWDEIVSGEVAHERAWSRDRNEWRYDEGLLTVTPEQKQDFNKHIAPNRPRPRKLRRRPINGTEARDMILQAAKWADFALVKPEVLRNKNTRIPRRLYEYDGMIYREANAVRYMTRSWRSSDSLVDLKPYWGELKGVKPRSFDCIDELAAMQKEREDIENAESVVFRQRRRDRKV